MTGHVLAVIVVTTFLAHPTPAPGNVTPRPVSEDDVRSIEGLVLSHGGGTLVVLSFAGERVRFDLSHATEVPAPLASGAPVVVEFVEREGGMEALVVYLDLADPASSGLSS